MVIKSLVFKREIEADPTKTEDEDFIFSLIKKNKGLTCVFLLVDNPKDATPYWFMMLFISCLSSNEMVNNLINILTESNIALNLVSQLDDGSFCKHSLKIKDNTLAYENIMMKQKQSRWEKVEEFMNEGLSSHKGLGTSEILRSFYENFVIFDPDFSRSGNLRGNETIDDYDPLEKMVTLKYEMTKLLSIYRNSVSEKYKEKLIRYMRLLGYDVDNIGISKVKDKQTVFIHNKESQQSLNKKKLDFQIALFLCHTIATTRLLGGTLFIRNLQKALNTKSVTNFHVILQEDADDKDCVIIILTDRYIFQKDQLEVIENTSNIQTSYV